MARISVVGTPFVSLLVWDLDRVQSLREHTINPPGQEQNIRSVDLVALQKALDAAGVTTEDAQDVVDATIGADDISLDTIDAATTETMDVEQQQAVQDILSVKLIETGNFKLSFNGGVLAKALELGWIKVFTDDGDALYSL